MDQLANYVLQQLNAGYKLNQVEQYLKQNNYSTSQIKQALEDAMELSSKTYVPYIDQQLKSGYSLSQIRAILLKQGYDYKILDHALNHYHKNFFTDIKDTLEHVQQHSVQEKQTEQSLKQSIQQGLQYGLTLENIQSNLIGQGYDPNLVSKEINMFRQSQVHIPKQSLGFIVIALIAIIGVSLGFMHFGGTTSPSAPINSQGTALQERLLDISVENAFPDKVLEPGDDLFFAIDLSAMGFQREFDIDFTYLILDASDKVVRKATTTKSSVSNLADSITLPGYIESGTYTLEVNAEYKGDTTAKASFQFDVGTGTVQEPAQPIDEKPSSQPSTEPVTEPPQQQLPESEPTETKADFAEELTSISYLSSSDTRRLDDAIAGEGAEYAFYLCRQIKDAQLEDDCKLYVAKQTSQDNCEKISSEAKKDKCYLEFAKESTDDAICENLQLKQARTICKIYVIKNKNLALNNIDNEDEYLKKVSESYQ